jgi:ribosomal-protein-alanine N-acetyltransferase
MAGGDAPRSKPAAETDTEAMAALHARCFDAGWEAWVMRGFALSDSFVCLIVEDEAGVAAGFVIAQIAADEAELITLAVDPDRRRLGLGRLLVEDAAERLKARGAVRLFFDVDEGNRAAKTLYESLGAAPVGRRQAYYANGADALILRLDL